MNISAREAIFGQNCGIFTQPASHFRKYRHATARKESGKQDNGTERQRGPVSVDGLGKKFLSMGRRRRRRRRKLRNACEFCGF